eukprot:1158219-Pelagomonas_calceolata.AAC.8
MQCGKADDSGILPTEPIPPEKYELMGWQSSQVQFVPSCNVCCVTFGFCTLLLKERNRRDQAEPAQIQLHACIEEKFPDKQGSQQGCYDDI